MEPLVFVIDIDGTMIGNIGPQIAMYEMRNQKIKTSFSNKELLNRFDQGLIRPYFDSFIKQIQHRIPYAEFFIYTASEDKWAKFLVNAIEQHLSVKFNRPLFTRRHCHLSPNKGVRKGMDIIVPYIRRTLQRKYGKQVNLTNRILLIDNTQVYDSFDQKFLLLCPTYKFTHVENIPALITDDSFHRYRSAILDTLARYFPAFQNVNINSYIDFQKQFYPYYVNALQLMAKPTDKFWFFLLRLIEAKQINTFTPNTVAYINSKLSKRL